MAASRKDIEILLETRYGAPKKPMPPLVPTKKRQARVEALLKKYHFPT